MGNEPSKPNQPPAFAPPKEGDIKVVAASELPKLDTSRHQLPKPPVIKTKSQLRQEAEEEE